MIEIVPENLDRHISVGGIRYLELTAEEVRKLPIQTPVSVAMVKNGALTGEVEQCVTGLRYSRPVLYKLPLQAAYKNIGSFSDRIYLYREKES